MSNERGSLRNSLTSAFRPQVSDEYAERTLLDGRTITGSESPAEVVPNPIPERPELASLPSIARTTPTSSLQLASNLLTSESRLRPRSSLNQEPNRMISFRCPIGMAEELARKAKYSNLTIQDVLAEGLRLVLPQIPEPPAGHRR